MKLSAPNPPSAPPPPPGITESQINDKVDKDVEEAARRRREIVRRRRGPSSLVIDPATSTPGNQGLSIG